VVGPPGLGISENTRGTSCLGPARCTAALLLDSIHGRETQARASSFFLGRKRKAPQQNFCGRERLDEERAHERAAFMKIYKRTDVRILIICCGHGLRTVLTRLERTVLLVANDLEGNAIFSLPFADVKQVRVTVVTND